MGFVFPQNFNSPYRAPSFREFWRRWHITLSRFLRDFLYIPLGGNRGGRWSTARNLMITMVLGGLWHGAAWGFVLWGALHGAALVHRARARAGGSTAPGLAALAGRRSTSSCSAGSCSAPRTSTSSGRSSRALVSPGPATLWTPAIARRPCRRDRDAAAAPTPLERLRLRVEGCAPLALGVGLAAVILIVGATVPSQGVPPFIYFQF